MTNKLRPIAKVGPGKSYAVQPALRSVKQMMLDHLDMMLENRAVQKQRADTVDDKVLINQSIWTIEDIRSYVENLPEEWQLFTD